VTFHIGTPYTNGAGYFINDKNLRTRQEADVQTCSHCQAVLLMQEWQRRGAWCGKCMKPLCLQCGKRTKVFGCEPFSEKFGRFVEKEAALAKVLKEVGPDEPVPQSLIIIGSR
jgi:hypothetical protein